MGNYAKVDELGFITPEKAVDEATSHVFIRIPCKQSILLNHALM